MNACVWMLGPFIILKKKKKKKLCEERKNKILHVREKRKWI